MKKNQNGVSMVSLVITIIVIIILAAVAFTGSEETIGRAAFSGFTTNIDSVKTAFITENIPNLIGNEASNNNSVSAAQAYNYLAKGATTTLIPTTDAAHTWLSRAQAEDIPCTRIEPAAAKEAIGIELPEINVNTYGATGVTCSYFITNKGDIFVWPPYARTDDGLFYVNDKVVVTLPDTATASGEIISGDREKAMYEDKFTFVVNGVNITVYKANENAKPLTGNFDKTAFAVDTNGSIFYNDVRNAESPEGLESKKIYNDRADAASSIAGVDED